jgi:putative N6-adenine-specific DNA methylase
MSNPRSRESTPQFELFAATAPGLESIAAGELKALGIRGRQEPGGVAFDGNLDRVYLANLWLRTASRVILRLGRFHASTFYELERRTRKLPWPDYLPESGRVEVRVTCRKSRLYHSDAVAERVLAAIAKVAPPGVNLRVSALHGEDEEENDASPAPTQLFVVRIVDDQCEISADTSGELLHRRGYRQEVAKAPLRETLAAAMLLASGWQRGEPLVDPMCGSGTIPIEAALLGRRIAPGLGRVFQFMTWQSFDRLLWEDTVAQAREAILDSIPGISGADRDAGAIQAATRNAARAGVATDLDFSERPISASLTALPDLTDGRKAGWIISNPPYGVRLEENADLRNLYAAIGSGLSRKPGWRIAMLTPDAALARQMRVQLRSRFATQNGGIPVNFLVSEKSSRIEPTAGKSTRKRLASEA